MGWTEAFLRELSLKAQRLLQILQLNADWPIISTVPVKLSALKSHICFLLMFMCLSHSAFITSVAHRGSLNKININPKQALNSKGFANYISLNNKGKLYV